MNMIASHFPTLTLDPNYRASEGVSTEYVPAYLLEQIRNTAILTARQAGKILLQH